MKISAIFTGSVGPKSMGFERLQRYNLDITIEPKTAHIKDVRTRIQCIEKPELFCLYSSAKSFMENWDAIAQLPDTFEPSFVPKRLLTSMTDKEFDKCFRINGYSIEYKKKLIARLVSHVSLYSIITNFGGPHTYQALLNMNFDLNVQ